MATHSNGISALQFQKQLGIGILPQRLAAPPQVRASMVGTRAQPVVGPLPRGQPSRFWTKDDPPTGGQGRSHDAPSAAQDAHRRAHRTHGNMPGRLQAGRNLLLRAPLTWIGHRRNRIDAIRENSTAGPATLRSPPIATMSMSSGQTAAHLVLPWIHQVFSRLSFLGWAHPASTTGDRRSPASAGLSR